MKNKLVLSSSSYEENIGKEHVAYYPKLIKQLFNVKNISQKKAVKGIGREFIIENWNTDIKDASGNLLDILIYKKHLIPVVEYKNITEYLTSIKEDKYNLVIGFIDNLPKSGYVMWITVNIIN